MDKHEKKDTEVKIKVEPAGTAGTEIIRTELIILGSFFRVAKHVIGFGNFFEFFFRSFIARILVRVIFDRKFPICLFQFGIRCGFGHPQYLIIIFRHVIITPILLIMQLKKLRRNLLFLRFFSRTGTDDHIGRFEQPVAHFITETPLPDHFPGGNGIGSFL